jgi:TonB family protein
MLAMKYLITTGLLLCLLGAPFHGIEAQKDSWIEVSADAEYFRVSMPHQPREENERTRYGPIDANCTRYEVWADGAGYALWALVNKTFNTFQATDPDKYLDDCADLVWEALLKPVRDKLPNDRGARAAMTYVKELPANPLAGREYSVALGDMSGTIRFYIAQTRIFVLLAVNFPGGVWARERFLGSFAVLPNLPIQRPNYGDSKSRGTGKTSEDDPVFQGSEVTQKIRVLNKPPPIYPESARKYGVTGTVVLRAVFSKDGEVTNLYVIRKLPHGLTQAAMRAARAIEFSPAMKDGRPVSQYMELQYNFNVY